MANKKEKDIKKQVDENPVQENEAILETEQVNIETEGIEQIQKELDEALNKVEENYNDYLKARAEFENFKRRTNEERLLIRSNAIEDVISGLLPVIDNFERAIEIPEEQKGNEQLVAFVEGTKMIYNQLVDNLSKLGLAEIDALNKPFDPNFHSGIMMVESDEHDSQTVVEVFQKGYMVGNKVVRPSMVKVSS